MLLVTISSSQSIIKNTNSVDSLIQLAEELFLQGNYLKAGEKADSCLSIAKQINLKFDRESEAFYYVGVMQYQKGMLIESELSFLNALERKNDNHHTTFASYFELSKIYRKRNDAKNAFDIYSKAINFGLQNLDLSKSGVIKNISQLASAMHRIGYKEECEHYMNMIVDAAIKEDMQYSTEMFNVYNMKGILAKNKGLYNVALDNYEKLERILKDADLDYSYEFALLLNNYGIVYKHLSQPQKALRYYKEAIEINKDLFKDTPHKYVSSLMNLAQIQGRLKFQNEAINNANEAVNIFKNHYGENSPEYLLGYLVREEICHTLGISGFLLKEEAHMDSVQMNVYKTMDVAYLKMKSTLHKEAKNYQKAIEFLDQSIRLIEENKLAAISSEYSEPINVYTNKGDIYYAQYEDTGQLESLMNAWEGYKKAIKFLTDTRKNNSFIHSAYYHIYRYNFLLNDGMDVCLQLFNITGDEIYVKEMLMISSLTKNIELDAIFNTQKGLELKVISEEDKLEGYNLQSNIETFESQLNGLNPDKDSLWFPYLDSLNAYKENRRKWFDHIENKYPQFYNFKYDFWNKSLSALREENLSDNELLIDYAKLDSTLFIISVSKDFVTARSLKYDENLESLVAQALESVSGHSDAQNIVLSQLTQILLEPELTNILNDDFSDLIISPDHQLSFLSFEMLGKGKPLIYDYSVRYIHSLNIKYAESRHGIKAMASFAPVYEEQKEATNNPVIAMLVRDGLWNLPGAIEESKKIIDIIGGKLYLGDQATEKQFSEHAQNYNVLHLSMHTLLHDSISQKNVLVFHNSQDTLFDGLLYDDELYNYKLNADLVVLSACNTGRGVYKKGKGVESLSNAFVYAGVPAIVMSYWKVPDHSTSEIMVSFYKYLKDGESKNEALRLAKLDYINNAQTEELKHPYYWAGFVLIGNKSAIEFSESFINYKSILGLALLIILGLFIVKRTKFNS